MAEKFSEHHENVKEYFPMTEKIKGRRRYSVKSKLPALASLAAVGAAAAIVITALLSVFCSPLEVTDNSAVFDTIVFNAPEGAEVYYALFAAEDGLTPEEALEKPEGDVLCSSPVPSQRSELRLDGLDSETDYLLVFYETTPEGETRVVKHMSFTTAASGEYSPVPAQSGPTAPDSGSAAVTPETTETPAPTETSEETVKGEIAPMPSAPVEDPESGTTSAEAPADPDLDASATVPAEETPTETTDTPAETVPAEPVKYSVSFNMNGHGSQVGTQTIESGKTASTPAAPTATGYTFGGWYADAACTKAFSFGSAITQNTTVYAKWTPVSYTVSFNMNGHGSAVSSQTVEYGKTASAPAAPTATGYTFGGWYADAACSKAFSFGSAITQNTTVYAKWTAETYTVSFNMNGHGSALGSQTVQYGNTAVEPAAPNETGYVFGGWYADAACTKAFSFGSAITQNTTVYAKWTAETYTVSFNMGGHGQQVSTQTVDYGSTAKQPAAPSETGYTFGGWYTDASYKTAFNFGSAITRNTTIYAKWTAETYTVSFNMGGHGQTLGSQTVAYGSTPVAPAAPSETGYTFDGWYADSAYRTAFDFNSAITQDTTVYAKWTAISYTVRFNMGGHGQAINTQTVYYGGTAREPAAPSETGYVFAGWYTDTGYGTAFDFSTVISRNAVVYAKWIAVPVPTGLAPEIQEASMREIQEESDTPGTAPAMIYANGFYIEFRFELNDVAEEQVSAMKLYANGSVVDTIDDYTITEGIAYAGREFTAKENESLTVYAELVYESADAGTLTAAGPELTVECGGMRQAKGSIELRPSAAAGNMYVYTLSISDISDGDGAMKLDDFVIEVRAADGSQLSSFAVTSDAFDQPSGGSWNYSDSFTIAAPTVITEFIVTVSFDGHWEYDLDGEQMMARSQLRFTETYSA